jgi:L-lactate dehydrogenase complex protein LldF
MSLFRNKIRAAIANDALQSALDKNAAQRIRSREASFSGLSQDFQTLKDMTHITRSDVIDNLEEYLTQFIENAAKNGFIIHQAANAAEARDNVLSIVKDHKAGLIAKSKTMMSEEIKLNQALEAAGVEVVETDLGEYIVQLRNEHPSHIITPAVHLRREDVGETFQKKLGIPYTADIPTLTNIARARLRQTFLDADIGISGVNFGVAETGSICIVTNEGNGRMVTTLPRVHIALMGIERLVPDMDSLALLIKMLPRSATGQKISVYTQLIKKPRKPGEIDGADERHIVLIDNGRRKLRQTRLAESLLCIRCGACINACPVFREIGGFSYTSRFGDYTPYPGPIGSVLSPGLFGQVDFGHLAQASTLCGACKEACPVDIDLPTLLLRVRSGGVDLKAQTKTNFIPQGIPPSIAWGLRAFTQASTHPSIFSAAQRLAAAVSKIYSPLSKWMVLPVITGWGYAKDFPRPAAKTFRKRWEAVGGIFGSSGTQVTLPPKGIPTTEEIPPAEHKISASLTDIFKAELTALSGNFILIHPDELSYQIISLLKEKVLNQALAWYGEHLPPGLLEELEKNGIGISFDNNPEVKVGITGVQAAIAETGTLAITSGIGHPATTSLLPEIHIAILYEKDIYENLPQVLHLQEIQSASSLTLISGPSRTADIEMTLTIGVHGPGELYVFCLMD